MLAFSLGTRRMELAAIRPEDVQGDVIHLRNCKCGKERRVELGPLEHIVQGPDGQPCTPISPQMVTGSRTACPSRPAAVTSCGSTSTRCTGRIWIGPVAPDAWSAWGTATRTIASWMAGHADGRA
jgi:hypothetical protein